MAVRIRKLARELDRSVVEVIGVLHALGFQRYRSADDMLPGTAERKLRKGLAQGVRPMPVDLPERSPLDRPVEAVAQADDLMARLVPGVVPAGRPAPRRATPPPRSAARPAPRPTPTAPTPAPAPAPPPPTSRALDARQEALASLERRLASERSVLEAERRSFDEERARIEARARALEAESAALTQLREALEGERDALAAERDHAPAPTSKAALLQELLEARGLRGADEFERAVIALASNRMLRDLLWTVRLDPAEPLVKLLAERLVLGEGEPHPALTRGTAFVAVSPERAEVPSASALSSLVGTTGERLLLHGCRRLRVVGGHPRWHRVLREALDPRIEVTFVVASSRSASEAREDLSHSDSLLLWDLEIAPDAAEVYDASSVIVAIGHGGLKAGLTALNERLQD